MTKHQVKNYIIQIKKIIKNFNIDIIYPNNENEIKAILKNRLKLKDKYIVHTGEQVFNLAFDKFNTYKELESSNFHVPWTIQANRSFPKEFPCIGKSRFGSGFERN